MNEETVLQVQCFEWHWNEYPNQRGLLHHNLNNAKDGKTGRLYKRMGVVRGVADLEYNYDGLTWFIELKTTSGRLSKDQEAFADKVQQNKFPYIVVRSFHQFKMLVNAIHQFAEERNRN